MPSLIAHLSSEARETLFADLNYLNIGDFRAFCDKHGIPYVICVETAAGVRKTRDTDRKSIVLDRIRKYLRTGRVPAATVFPQHVVAPGKPPTKFEPADHLYYGWYDKHSPALLDALRQLTAGKYRNGAVARILMREFWTAGQAPTLREFSKRWSEEHARGLGEHPEAAWLTDRARQTAGTDWKQKRIRIARRVLRHLSQIAPPR